MGTPEDPLASKPLKVTEVTATDVAALLRGVADIGEDEMRFGSVHEDQMPDAIEVKNADLVVTAKTRLLPDGRHDVHTMIATKLPHATAIEILLDAANRIADAATRQQAGKN